MSGECEEIFPSIDRVHEMLDEIAEELPKEFYDKLNEGIVLLPQVKYHPESRESDYLYIMGEYCYSITGSHITIYYGSFKKLCAGWQEEDIKKRLRQTLYHEFTHHIENRAGLRDLEVEDERQMREYRERK